MDPRDIDKRFAYHPPKDEPTADMHANVRDHCWTLAAHLNDLLPDCREKSLVITKIEEAMFWANGAIAREISADAS